MSSTELSERLEREYRASASAAREPYDWEAEGTFDDWEVEGILNAHAPIRAEVDEWTSRALAAVDPEWYEKKVRADAEAELRTSPTLAPDLFLVTLGAVVAGWALSGLVHELGDRGLNLLITVVGASLTSLGVTFLWRDARRP